MGKEISWLCPEYIHKEKGATWYYAVLIIAGGISTASALLNNYIFAIFIALATFSLILFASKKPKMIEVRINEQGVLCDKYFYPFSTLESFWLDENTYPKLILKSKKVIMPYISFPVNIDDLDGIREFLRNYIKEEPLHEPILHKIIEAIGF